MIIRKIQILRGIAVSFVVGFHFFPTYFKSGYLGVDAFFVISGYVVTGSLMKLRKRNFGDALKTFYLKRFWRLIPALGVTIVASSLLFLPFTNTEVHERYWKQAIASLLFLGNFGAYLYSGDYFSTTLNPLVHTWSLAVEEQTYLLLPLLILPSLQLNTRKFFRLIFSIACIISFLVFAVPSISDHIHTLLGIRFAEQLGFSFYSPIGRFWEFGIGTFVFYLSNRKFRKNISAKIWKSTSLLFMFVLATPNEILDKRLHLLLAVFLTALLIYPSESVGKSRFGNVLERIGYRSYSIYLIHMPLVVFTSTSDFIRDLNSIGQLGFNLIALYLLTPLLYKIESRFRIKTPGLERIPFIKYFKVFVAPLCILLILQFANENRYFGLNRNPDPPDAAWSQDPFCDRNNSPIPCSYGNSSYKREILLIGDSTAGALRESIIKIGETYNSQVNIWSRGGCNFIIIPTGQMSKTDCEIHNSEVLKWIQLNSPWVTIISNSVGNKAQLLPALEAAQDLQKLTNLIYVGQTPIFPDSENYQVRKSLLSEVYVPPERFPVGKMDKGSIEIAKEMETYSNENNLPYINLLSVFCPDNVCFRKLNKNWLYFDSSHLSLQGADYLVPQFVEEFEKFNEAN